jgi:cytochrome c oxidase subunit 1
MVFGGTGFAFFAALHFWWPKMFGIMYDFKKAYIAAFLITTGFLVHYMPMFVLGMQGMPRRYYDYLPQYETGNFIAGIGGYLILLGIGLMFYNLLASFRRKEAAGSDPWGGTTLEWSVPSPPPLHNFPDTPKVKSFPYDFTDVVRKNLNEIKKR